MQEIIDNYLKALELTKESLKKRKNSSREHLVECMDDSFTSAYNAILLDSIKQPLRYPLHQLNSVIMSRTGNLCVMMSLEPSRITDSLQGNMKNVNQS